MPETTTIRSATTAQPSGCWCQLIVWDPDDPGFDPDMDFLDGPNVPEGLTELTIPPGSTKTYHGRFLLRHPVNGEPPELPLESWYIEALDARGQPAFGKVEMLLDRPGHSAAWYHVLEGEQTPCESVARFQIRVRPDAPAGVYHLRARWPSRGDLNDAVTCTAELRVGEPAPDEEEDKPNGEDRTTVARPRVIRIGEVVPPWQGGGIPMPVPGAGFDPPQEGNVSCPFRGGLGLSSGSFDPQAPRGTTSKGRAEAVKVGLESIEQASTIRQQVWFPNLELHEGPYPPQSAEAHGVYKFDGRVTDKSGRLGAWYEFEHSANDQKWIGAKCAFLVSMNFNATFRPYARSWPGASGPSSYFQWVKKATSLDSISVPRDGEFEPDSPVRTTFRKLTIGDTNAERIDRGGTRYMFVCDAPGFAFRSFDGMWAAFRAGLRDVHNSAGPLPKIIRKAGDPKVSPAFVGLSKDGTHFRQMLLYWYKGSFAVECNLEGSNVPIRRHPEARWYVHFAVDVESKRIEEQTGEGLRWYSPPLGFNPGHEADRYVFTFHQPDRMEGRADEQVGGRVSLETIGDAGFGKDLANLLEDAWLAEYRRRRSSPGVEPKSPSAVVGALLNELDRRMVESPRTVDRLKAHLKQLQGRLRELESANVDLGDELEDAKGVIRVFRGRPTYSEMNFEWQLRPEVAITRTNFEKGRLGVLSVCHSSVVTNENTSFILDKLKELANLNRLRSPSYGYSIQPSLKPSSVS